ncbi:uncharacterized protein [Battus philenor]|uniref:uncharacterized protein n=1 Tax=Battus philenor TaxID=42288 RepID=UPI0035D006A3
MKMIYRLILFGIAVSCIIGAPTSLSPLEKQQPTVVPIVSQSEELEPNGTYKFSYETGNGIKREETSYDKVIPKTARHSSNSEEGEESDEYDNSDEIHVQRGSYSYTAPDGTIISLSYIADENGFRPIGAHLPRAPVPDTFEASSVAISGSTSKDNSESGSMLIPRVKSPDTVSSDSDKLSENVAHKKAKKHKKPKHSSTKHKNIAKLSYNLDSLRSLDSTTRNSKRPSIISPKVSQPQTEPLEVNSSTTSSLPGQTTENSVTTSEDSSKLDNDSDIQDIAAASTPQSDETSEKNVSTLSVSEQNTEPAETSTVSDTSTTHESGESEDSTIAESTEKLSQADLQSGENTTELNSNDDINNTSNSVEITTIPSDEGQTTKTSEETTLAISVVGGTTFEANTENMTNGVTENETSSEDTEVTTSGTATVNNSEVLTSTPMNEERFTKINGNTQSERVIINNGIFYLDENIKNVIFQCVNNMSKN